MNRIRRNKRISPPPPISIDASIEDVNQKLAVVDEDIRQCRAARLAQIRAREAAAAKREKQRMEKIRIEQERAMLCVPEAAASRTAKALSLDPGVPPGLLASPIESFRLAMRQLRDEGNDAFPDWQLPEPESEMLLLQSDGRSPLLHSQPRAIGQRRPKKRKSWVDLHSPEEVHNSVTFTTISTTAAAATTIPAPAHSLVSSSWEKTPLPAALSQAEGETTVGARDSPDPLYTIPIPCSSSRGGPDAPPEVGTQDSLARLPTPQGGESEEGEDDHHHSLCESAVACPPPGEMERGTLRDLSENGLDELLLGNCGEQQLGLSSLDAGKDDNDHKVDEDNDNDDQNVVDRKPTDDPEEENCGDPQTSPSIDIQQSETDPVVLPPRTADPPKGTVLHGADMGNPTSRSLLSGTTDNNPSVDVGIDALAVVVSISCGALCVPKIDPDCGDRDNELEAEKERERGGGGTPEGTAALLVAPSDDGTHLQHYADGPQDSSVNIFKTPLARCDRDVSASLHTYLPSRRSPYTPHIQYGRKHLYSPSVAPLFALSPAKSSRPIVTALSLHNLCKSWKKSVPPTAMRVREKYPNNNTPGKKEACHSSTAEGYMNLSQHRRVLQANSRAIPPSTQGEGLEDDMAEKEDEEDEDDDDDDEEEIRPSYHRRGWKSDFFDDSNFYRSDLFQGSSLLSY